MSDDTSILDSLRASLAEAQAKLAAAKSQAAAYQAKADEIDGVYRELKEKKGSMKTLNDELENFQKEKYEFWKGTLWSSDYQTAVGKVSTAYDTVIEIDTNLDNLNWEKTKYENLAYESYGLVGQLAGTVNNLATRIQNFFN